MKNQCTSRQEKNLLLSEQQLERYGIGEAHRPLFFSFWISIDTVNQHVLNTKSSHTHTHTQRICHDTNSL